MIALDIFLNEVGPAWTHTHILFTVPGTNILSLLKKFFLKITSLALPCPVDFIPKMGWEKRKKKEMLLYKARDTVTWEHTLL